MTTWHLYCAIHLSGELTVLGPKCHSGPCLAVVTTRVHWPTGPLDVCGGCALAWARIAETLGYVMHEEPLHYTPVGPDAPDDTEQRMQLLELN